MHASSTCSRSFLGSGQVNSRRSVPVHLLIMETFRLVYAYGVCYETKALNVQHLWGFDLLVRRQLQRVILASEWMGESDRLVLAPADQK